MNELDEFIEELKEICTEEFEKEIEAQYREMLSKNPDVKLLSQEIMKKIILGDIEGAKLLFL